MNDAPYRLEWRPVPLLLAGVALVALGVAIGRSDPLIASVAGGLAVMLLFLGLEPAAAAPSQPAAPEPRPSVDSAPERASLIQSHPQPIVLVSQRLTVIESNAPARQILGVLRPNESLGLYLRQPAVLETIRQSVAVGTPAEAELTVLSPLERTYTLHCLPLGEADGGAMITLHDITRLRLTERARVDFVANASHELRTPLSTLIGFIETLQGPAAEDEAARRRFLPIMATEAERMARLIDDLLSLSRVEMDKNIRPSSPLDLQPLLRDVGKTLAMRLSSDQRRIALDLPDSLPMVIADRDQVLQVLHNLISNAIKYGRTGTPIELKAQVHAGSTPAMVRISVRDEGDGIPAEHIPRLTERFYRVDTARSRTLGGTGLGLAIVKHIVERHRGTLEIGSTMGTGTTVSFSLPIADAESIGQITQTNQAAQA